MTYDAALDTSATTTAICVVSSRTGEIVLESSVITDPDAIFAVLAPYLPRLHLVRHEATTWSAWLHGALEARGVARKLAVIMHRMWLDGTPFRLGDEADLAPPVAA